MKKEEERLFAIGKEAGRKEVVAEMLNILGVYDLLQDLKWDLEERQNKLLEEK